MLSHNYNNATVGVLGTLSLSDCTSTRYAAPCTLPTTRGGVHMEGGLARHVHTAPAQLTHPRRSEPCSSLVDEGAGEGEGGRREEDDARRADADADAPDIGQPRRLRQRHDELRASEVMQQDDATQVPVQQKARQSGPHQMGGTQGGTPWENSQQQQAGWQRGRQSRVTTTSTVGGGGGGGSIAARAGSVSSGMVVATEGVGEQRRHKTTASTSSRKNKNAFALAFKPRGLQAVAAAVGEGRHSGGDVHSSLAGHWTGEGPTSTRSTSSEMWGCSSSSEDDVSILNDGSGDGSSDEGVEIGATGGRGGSDAEDAAGAEERRTARTRRILHETALCDAVSAPTRANANGDLGAHVITTLDWSFQNLERVPPGLASTLRTRLHLRLQCLDVSHNNIWKLPSNLALFDSLVELDASHNRLEKLPPALGRCQSLRVLRLHSNRLRKLGTWVAELPHLRQGRRLSSHTVSASYPESSTLNPQPSTLNPQP